MPLAVSAPASKHRTVAESGLNAAPEQKGAEPVLRGAACYARGLVLEPAVAEEVLEVSKGGSAVTYEMYALRGLLPGAASREARQSAHRHGLQQRKRRAEAEAEQDKVVASGGRQNRATSEEHRDSGGGVAETVRQLSRRSLRRARRTVRQRTIARVQKRRTLEREIE